MRKKIVFSACFFVSLVFSGCAFGNAGVQPATNQKFVLSKSIWVSQNGGKDWQPSNRSNTQPLVSDPNPLLMIFDSNNPKVAYLGLLKGGIMKTVDGGETWDFLNLKSDKIYGLALDPSNSNTIYTSAFIRGRGKILKSTDGGENWDEIFTFPINGPVVISLTVDKRNSKVVYASTSDNQIIKSVDSGASWKNIFQSSAPTVRIVLDSGNSSLLYLLTQNGQVYSSQNSGDSFEAMDERLTKASLGSSGYLVLEVDPSHSGWLYLGGNMGIVRSKDVGASWDKIVVLNNPNSAPVSALAINPTNSGEMIYGAAQATFKSVDEGKNWSTSQFEVGKPIHILKYNPLDVNIVYAGFMLR